MQICSSINLNRPSSINSKCEPNATSEKSSHIQFCKRISSFICVIGQNVMSRVSFLKV